MNRVWILGAGFSASLGGPLLADLFSERSEVTLQADYRLKTDYSNVPQSLAVHLFRWGSGQSVVAPPVNPAPGARLWLDAEDYLDRLDSARKTGSDARHTIDSSIRRMTRPAGVLKNWIDSNGNSAVNQICLEAKHWMAAECCAFLDHADLESERWRPYREWVNSLGENDSILTFNYDRVLEKINEEFVRGSGEKQLHIVNPVDASLHRPLPPVFKLHGSVDWEFSAERDVFEISSNPRAAVDADLSTIGIATPGPAKKLAVGQLGKLWDRAMDQLARADRVYFLGYRFPETDTEALFRLLAAMRDRTHVRSRSIRVVLGPDKGDSRCVRLGTLLNEVVHGNCEIVPLWAQDFIATHSLANGP